MIRVQTLNSIQPGWFMVPDADGGAGRLTFFREWPNTLHVAPELLRLWYVGKDGALTLRALRDGTVLAVVEPGPEARPSDFLVVQVSRGGEWLFVTRASGDASCTMTVLSLGSGEVAREATGLPDLLSPLIKWTHPLVAPMTPEGRHLFAAVEGERGAFRSVLVSLDAQTGVVEILRATAEGGKEAAKSVGLVAPRTDGALWFKRAEGEPPTRQPTRLKWLRRVADGPEQTALEVDLWSGVPPAREATLVVDWRGPDGKPLYEHPRLNVTDDRTPLVTFQPKHLPVWTGDGEAAWFDADYYYVCVGLDGQASRRFFKPQVTGDPFVVAGEGRQARIMGLKEVAEIDGAPIEGAFDLPPVMPEVGRRADVPSDEEMRALHAEIRRRTEAASHLTLDLSDLPTPDAALDAIARAFMGGAMDMAQENFDLRFTRDGKRVMAKTFWRSVMDQGPDVLPALRRAIEAFLARAPSDRFYTSAGDGESTLAPAVACLARLDERAADGLVLRYAAHFDGSNHGSLFGAILPAATDAHGWTDAVLRLALWAVFVDRGQTPEDPGYVWNEGGLSRAVSERYTTDEALALIEPLCHPHVWPKVRERMSEALQV